MEPLASYAERLNHLPLDLRAEVVLGDMLEEGISPDELIVNPVGAFKRAFGRDIDRTGWVESQQGSRRWLQIDLNRNGLYDLVPEGVFHQPMSSEAPVSKEGIQLEMKAQRQREQAARRFFLPIEQEFFRQRIRIEQERRSLSVQTGTLFSDDLLGQFWGLPDFLTPQQTKRLVHLLPMMHRIAGDPSAMTDCIEQLIEERVSLHPAPPGLVAIEAETAPLGQWQLGDSSVFDGLLADEIPTLCLTIHLERSERVATYLPGQNGRRLVEWMTGFLIPLDVGVCIVLDTSTLEDTFRFTGEASDSRLDFTTCI